MRTETLPLVIYLDTQDYINVHNHGNDAKIVEVLNYLKAKISSGQVIVASSPMVVLEFLTRPGEGFMADRIDRGRLIKTICGLNTFSMDFSPIGKLLRSDGNWVGRDLAAGLSLGALLRKGLKDAQREIDGNPNLNRATRRRMKNEAFLLSQLKSGASTFGRSKKDFEPIPVTQEFVDGRYLERYLRGQISEETVHQAMIKWILDPEEFCKVFYEYKGHENALEKFFGPTISAIHTAAQQGEELCSMMLEAKKVRINIRNNLIEAGVEKREARKLTPAIQISANFDSHRVKIEEAYGVGRAEHFIAYMMAMLTGKAQSLSSDFGDLFHFIYAYECDLFRCDRKMAHIMSEIESLKDRLVASFFDLPSRIEQKLSTASQQA